MNRIIDLQTALLDLLYEIRNTGENLIVGGGYGIYLKMGHLRRTGEKTLFENWPEPRSTNDLDLFLRPELLIESEKLKPIAQALERLKYTVVPSARNYQFSRLGPDGTEAGGIKVDMLTGPRSRFDGTKVKTDSRRARPRPSVGIHAHPVDEALSLEKGLLSTILAGNLSSGDPWKTEVLLPHPYTFSLMKLFAFRDRLDDENKEFGRYHALDLYTILATTTEQEWQLALKLKAFHNKDPIASEAGRLIANYFSNPEQLGMLRLRESIYFRPELQIEDFMSVLKDLFYQG
ncbi:MAG: hypothetical protein JJV98_19625 [Desulfosarcina sp.]|nr:hypothetical protein [Desulfobacterales bacterium]